MTVWLFAISEGFRSLWQYRFVAALSIFTISAALFVLGFFVMISLNLHNVLLNIQEKIAVEIFLEDNTNKSQVTDLIDEIAKIDGVKSVTFVTKADALTRFSDKYS